ncbi:MAG: NnrS family protein [Gammaproteobacteria bacterium]|nr:NnrS family protein [Gammaproteobacteria bacterium]
MLNIEERKSYPHALDHLGFRPFFLLAGLFAVLLMAVWFWLLHINKDFSFNAPISLLDWHAHEMVYGYAMAAITGFLLTAVRNWTNIQTLHGPRLLILALFWILARLSPLIPHQAGLPVMAVADMIFGCWMLAALFRPLKQAGQRQHFGILAILALLVICNMLFYLTALHIQLPVEGARLITLPAALAAEIGKALYLTSEMVPRLMNQTGLYLVLALVLIMARRVVPFFIEKGVDAPVTLHNYRLLDISSLILLFLFIPINLMLRSHAGTILTAAVLAVLHSIRLIGWYTPGIWQKPLLWVLYAAYGWIAAGFCLLAVGELTGISSYLALHAFAVGGIGMMTLGMMARVALGHTGRNVFDPPAQLRWIFLLTFVGSICRVILPMVFGQWYMFWLILAQLCWIGAFAWFSFLYAPMLIQPRVDGRYG